MSGETREREREFPFADAEFQKIRRVVGEYAGINLSEAKRDMVYGRLVRRLRELKIDSFERYLALLEEGGDEFGRFIDAITTNLTSFFREPHHFQYLSEVLIPRLVETRPGRRLRVWSAGCSTGEEPYSIAMVLRETLPPGWDARILATDLSSEAVATAERGIYDQERIRNVGRIRLRRWFMRGRGRHEGAVRVKKEIRNMVRFRQLNLLRSWPMRGPLDIVFCRNVVIYFAKETQKVLFDRYADILTDDGHLFLGHSESLFKVCDRFSLIGNTIYRKVA